MTIQTEMRTDYAIALQNRLQLFGYYNLRVDGELGQGTSNAVVEFKRRNGLRARLKVGPLTLGKLFGTESVISNDRKSNSVISEAQSWLGLKEFHGSANNPKIMQMAQNLDLWYPGDDIPWCGLFAAHVNATVYPDQSQDFNRLGAREWLNWGVDAGETPLLGATAVFWRISRDDWRGHVAPAVTGVTRDGKAIRVIGGNQSDSVSEIWFPTSRVLGYRKAASAVLSKAPVAKLGSFSQGEA